MPSADQPCVHLLVFGASLRKESLNNRLASSAAAVLRQLGASVDDTLGCFIDLVEAAKHYPGLKKQWIEFLGEQPSNAVDRVETANVEAEAV